MHSILNNDDYLKLIEYKYQFYCNDYAFFQSKSRNIDTYLFTYNTKIFVSKNINILYYSSTKKDNRKNAKTFLVIPSIFNSPEILFLNKKKSFMSYLRDIGDVYLVDWQEIEDPNHRLDDYVKEVCQALSFVNKATSAKIDIIGHCIGGNLALAACIINQIYINSLTLLTTPWDFSHLSGIFTVNKYLNLNNNVKSLPKIPKLYIQILFFLLFPNYFNIKLDKYFKLTNNRDKEFFLRVEDWLMSGNSLPNKAYFQIINDIEQNKQSKTKWVIDDIIIEPKLLNKKIYMVIATDDQVVPKSSVLPLYQSFEAAELIELPGGHISYLINDQVEKFFTVYTS